MDAKEAEAWTARSRQGAEAATGRWRPELPRITQGFVVSAFAHLPVAVALFLDASGSERGWLRALRQVAPITHAAEKEANRADPPPLPHPRPGWSG
jgi:hypothetical protein